MPVEYESLAAAECESAVSWRSGSLDARRVVHDMLVQGKSKQQFTGDDPWQQFRLLRFVAQFQDRIRSQQNRGD